MDHHIRPQALMQNLWIFQPNFLYTYLIFTQFVKKENYNNIYYIANYGFSY